MTPIVIAVIHIIENGCRIGQRDNRSFNTKSNGLTIEEVSPKQVRFSWSKLQGLPLASVFSAWFAVPSAAGSVNVTLLETVAGAWSSDVVAAVRISKTHIRLRVQRDVTGKRRPRQARQSQGWSIPFQA